MKRVLLYRANAVILFFILTVVLVYFGRMFLIPLAFSIIFSMLMLPVSRKLESWGVKRWVAALLCVLILVLCFLGFIGIISAQAASFSKDLPQIQNRLQQVLDTVQQWIQSRFGVAPQEQIQFAKSQVSQFSASANKFFTGLVKGIFGLLTSFVLILLYMFFLMWQRDKYKRFFLKLFSREDHPETKETLYEVSKVASEYLGGRLISMLFPAAIYSIGFSIVGLKNAILLSLIAVIPTIIPYVGAIIGGIFPLIMAFVSASPSAILPTLAVLVAAQAIDNNLIEPFVMGAKMNLSPLVTIIAIVAGELVWGIAGMILFVPLFAIIKIVCDHVPRLHPYGYLLADEVGEPQWVGKIKDKVSQVIK